ncbi:glycosyltransferase [Microvirga mediterraneensis]|uniref:Glycosyltransferase n=1 Tax=Microvirga mediterraneensis TaxID=2754695 RepID=A0A838BS88_9HYPH|nr:glycosyltransferase [Microvirga mediterraneensis]MBA1158190.1 glycosyltransferase [Microvirga mediterraneensis]
MTQDTLHSSSQEADTGGGGNAASLHEQLERQREEITELQATISRLQAEIKGLRGSLSWMVTRPLRTLARGLPGVAALVRRTIDRSRDVLVVILPKRTVRVLFDNRWEVRDDLVEQISAYGKSVAGGRKIVLYTAIFGEYDNLLLPERIDPDVDYVCFTDRPRNGYGVWQMRASPFYHPDPTRIARWVKTHPHELFPGHEVAIWLDANIILKGDIHRYIGLVAGKDAHLGLIAHPHRACFYDEAEACKRLNKDAAKLIDRQVEEYRKAGLPLKQPLFETGFMIVPLNRQETSAALHLWWQQIERYSRRDQLGLAWVSYRCPDLDIVSVLPQGASVRDHEDFRYFRHSFAQALMVPEGLLKLGTLADPLANRSFAEVKNQRLQSLAEVPIDVVVCVHNALEDVRLCLESAWACLLPSHRIFIVNDCSDEETSSYLREFVEGRESVILLNNNQNLGYTRSANRGLAAGTADFRILLNSDTIVSPNWALKLLEVANRSPRIGIVGPLSNAAGAQSIPQIKPKGKNTAINLLPPGMSPSDLDLACETWSDADLAPRVPLIHGFCFGIKKEVIESIGFFDDENFKLFYGEENDYCFRALAAGFELSVATNTFVYHRKSRSIDEEKRVVHMAEAWKRLRELHGTDKILVAYRQVERHPMLERMRKKAEHNPHSSRNGRPS